MNNRTKLIIFFALIAVLILVLGIIWMRQGGGSIEASPAQIQVVKQSNIAISLDDYLDTVSPGSTSIYNLKVKNNSSQDLENLRIFGFVGLPQGETLVSHLIPSWLVPEESRSYPDQYYFNYVIDLAAGADATAKIPIKIKKFNQDQTQVFASAKIQALTGSNPWWNIFSLGGGYSGPIIASVEDINILE